MRLHNLTATAIVLATLLACLANPAVAEIAWQNDLPSAHRQATEQNKPLLLHFYSDNCVWCDRLEAGAFQSPDVAAAIDQQFVPVKVYATKAPELVKMFQVTKFPTDVIVTPTGKALSHSVSPQDPSRYVAMLTQAAAQMPSSQPSGLETRVAATTTANATMSRPTANPHVNAAMPVPNFGGTQSQPTSVKLPVGGATAQLAGVKTDGMSLGMPMQSGDIPPAAKPDARVATKRAENASQPDLAMNGYCAVTVIDEDRWTEGNPKFGVVHLGKLYLFESTEKMQTFLADPTPYTPVLNEIDVVRFFEERKIVPGKREFGMKDPTYGRMFFFADEASMNHFYNEYQRYTDAAIDVMEQAVRDANPM